MAIPTLQQIRLELAKRELPAFAQHALRIKPKSGGYIPFTLNKAQLYLHSRLEQQLKEKGKVRAVILKGRQQGCSTYVGARFFHKTIVTPAMLTFIFAHDAEASSSLFDMVKNYYDLLGLPELAPTRGATNAKELLFPEIKSGYKVGTAGTKGLGRSKTFQLVHWSEVAYSPNSDEHAAGILETVADAPGTEIILESTANGQNNFFHRKCEEALRGDSDYEMIFIPWFWQDEYRKAIPVGWRLEPEEEELLRLYGQDGMTEEHLVWRRQKLIGFHGDIWRFKREYPNNPQEAFEASDEASYIKAADVQLARLTAPMPTSAPLIIGVDPARLGNNRAAIVHRVGRNITKVAKLEPMTLDKLANALAQEINKYRPLKMCIDVGGLGVGVYDMLRAMGFGHVVVAVNFGATADEKDRYVNKRCEMYGRLNEWLREVPCSIGGADIRLMDAFQAELTAVRISDKADAAQRLKLETKDEMKERGVASPDLADAAVLTFAITAPLAEVTTSNQRFHAQQVQADINFNPFGGDY